MPAIPLSRFEKFLARSVVAAYNAKVALMQTKTDGGNDLPIKTGEFVLTINGTLVDDMGGAGLNEIVRLTRNLTPGSTTTTTANDPVETTVTADEPVETTTAELSADQVAELNSSTRSAEETTKDESSDKTDETGRDETQENAQQAYGRNVETTNEYTE